MNSVRPLSDLTTLISRGIAPKYTDERKTVVINQKCIRDGQVNLSLSRFHDHEIKGVPVLKIICPRDILVNSTGVGTLGRVSQVVHTDGEMTVDSHVTIVRPDISAVDPDYLGAFLFINQMSIEALGHGSTGQTELSRHALGDLEVRLPSRDHQKFVGQLFQKFHKKIELNQKINQTLEEIAKAIFKSWFVDFDPVRAKAEGRPTGLPSEISDLFPDEFVDSEIGEIPKGWDIKSAESLFDITIGRTPPRKESQWFSELETDIPWVSIRDMGDCGTFISKTSEYLTPDAVSKHRMHKLPAGSVLVSFKLTVGRVAITTKNMTTNEAIAHFPPSDAFPHPNFAYFYLKGFGYESLGSTSSIATAVNSKMIKAIPFIVAKSDLTEKFEETVAPMMDRIRLASEETHVLSELRDTLLPKLISGEFRIPDAEKFLEEAGI